MTSDQIPDTHADAVKAPGELKTTSARGAVVTLVSQVAKFVVQLGGTLLLARMLTPYDFGLMAMLLVVVGVAEVIRDFGLSTAAIQTPHLGRAQRDNLVWINTGVGLLLALIVLAGAGLVSRFYDQPELTGMLAAVSVIFVLNGFATQYRASLSRGFRFTAVAVAETGSMALATALAITAAVLGMGYWSLVILQVAQSVTALAIVLIASRWWPRWYSRGASMGSLLRFGLNHMCAQVINYASRNVDTVVIGARFGATPLGFYNNAYLLLRLPLNQISTPASNVAMPVLARLQEDRARFDAYLVRGQTVVLHLVAFAFALLAAQAHPAVALALGPQWGPTADLLVILAAGGLFQAAGSATQWTMLALGHSGSFLRLMITTRSAMTVLVLTGSIWGVQGVAWAYSLSCFVVWAIGLCWIARSLAAPWRRLVATLGRVVAVYGAGFLASWESARLLAGQPAGVQVLVGALVLLGTVGVAYAVWPAFRRDARSVLAVATYVRMKVR